VPITVSGTQPLLDGNRQADKLLQRARSYAGLIVAADANADDLLNSHPRRLNGRWPLSRVHLDVKFAAPEHMLLTIHPITEGPRRGTGEDSQLQHALRVIDGQLLTYSDHSRQIRGAIPRSCGCA
jgi:hypothetical protein